MIVRLAVEPSRVVQHEIEPCRCHGRINAVGDTCALCGRYPLATLLEAAVTWYPTETDELLRSFRYMGDV